MIGSIRAEWLKLWRRPANWVLGISFCGAILMVGYVFVWLSAFIVKQTPPSSDLPNPAQLADEIRAELVPAQFLGASLALFSSLGGAVAIILGALALGSEYSWGTLKTIFTQGPGRLVILSGKTLALAGVLLVFTVGALVAGLLGSLLIAAIEGAPIALPNPARILAALGAGWLILATRAALGLALAALLRSTSLAVGLGLVYVLIIESVLGGITIFVDTLQSLERVFIGSNSNALATAFATPGRIPAAQATLVLILYLVVFLAVTGALLQRRDVP